ncbi:RING-H2 finger protein ATL80-like [Magnolia sinica]|uniref:RING-H2 finger protein ATL80-like n=1 Tax=Magnolia sinica TaxID=86752 RepID=UPI0026595572|nr:RING-H2 finger protein ATL80-like [Magnolia sinica]
MFGKENNMALMVVGFAASMLFIVFVCTRLLCARIVQFTDSRRSIPMARPRSDLSILERGLHGLEPLVVATFPTKKFSDEFFSSGEDTQCTVCLAEYQEKDTLRILPYCGHFFHVACIDLWLQQNSTCPVCRISLRDSSDRKQIMPPMFSVPVRSSPHAPGIFDSLWYSSRMVGAPQTELVQEDQLPLHLNAVEDGEVNSTVTTVGNNVPKNIGHHCLEGKHVESPSNT